MGWFTPNRDCGCCDAPDECEPITLTLQVSGFPTTPQNCTCTSGSIPHTVSGFGSLNGSIVASTVGKPSGPPDFCQESTSQGLRFESSVDNPFNPDLCDQFGGKTATVGISGGVVTASGRVSTGAETVNVNMPTGSEAGDSHSETVDILLCTGTGSAVEATITITLTLS